MSRHLQGRTCQIMIFHGSVAYHSGWDKAVYGLSGLDENRKKEETNS